MATVGEIAVATRQSQCCSHTSRTLSDALRALKREVGLPSLKKKSDFKIMHEHFEELDGRLWDYFLAHSFLAHSDDEHAVSAVCIMWSRMFLDDVLWSKLGRDAVFQQCVLDLARPGQCDLRLWDYFLAHSFLAHSDDEHAVSAVCIMWSRMFLDDVLWSKLGRDAVFQQCVLDLARPGQCDLRLLCYAQMVDMYAQARANEPQNLAHVELLCALMKLIASLPGRESLISDILATAVCALINNVVQPRRGVSHFTRPLQAQILDHFVSLAGCVSLCAFEKIFFTIGSAIETGAIQCPPLISARYSQLLIGLLRYGGARTRRLAFVQLNTAHDPFRTATPFLSLAETGPALSPDLRGVLESWGLERCESARLERTAATCRDILHTLTTTRNMTAAALRLFLLILEDTVGVKFERDCGKRLGLGGKQPRPCGLGFESWCDLLLFASSCVRRLQQQTVDAYFAKNKLGRAFPVGYIALVLEIQHIFNLQALASARDRSYRHAVPLVADGLRQYPGDLWLMFADFWTNRHLEELKTAERGQADYVEALEQMRRGVSLALKSDTPVALLLLAAIARCAFQITTTCWGSLTSAQCAPMLSFANDVAARYLSRCPPDGLDRLGMVQIRIICLLIIDGPEVDEDITNLPLVRDLKQAQQFHESLYETRRQGGSHLPGVCLELALILSHYRDAAQWQSGLQYSWQGAGRKEFHDTSSYARRMDPFCCPSNEDVSRWFAALSDGAAELTWGQMPHKVFLRLAASPKMLNDVPTCTHCWKRNPVLRKCAGSHEAAYCDVACQRKDWVGMRTMEDGKEYPFDGHRRTCARLDLRACH